MTQSADSITELFASDPLDWTDQDLDRMIAYFRKIRKDVKAAEAEGKKPRAAKAPTKPSIDVKGVSGADLLGKLGLD